MSCGSSRTSDLTERIAQDAASGGGRWGARPAHAADGSRAGANHAFDLLWVERWAAAWGPSRHSAVLYAHEEGEPLPATRALLRLVRRKVEGEGVLDSVAARGEA